MACFTALRMICSKKRFHVINVGFNSVDIESAFFQNKKFSSMKNYLNDKYPSGKDGRKYTSSDLDALFKCWGL